MRRILAGILVFAVSVVVCGFFGCGGGGDEAALYVTSDIHSNFTGLDTHMRLVAENEKITPRHVLTGGDYFVSGDNPGMADCVDKIKESAKKHFSHDTRVTFTMGNHDWQAYSLNRFEAESGMKNTGEQASAKLYTIYTIGYPDGDNSLGFEQDYFSDNVISKLDTYLSGMKNSKKAVFIQSHITIHTGKNSLNYDRTVTGSDKMVDMLNYHAEFVDIVFFWGHCHSNYEPHRRTVKISGDAVSCVTGDNTPIDKTIKFTYANSGAMINYHANQSAAYVILKKEKITVKYYVLSPDQTSLTLESTYTVERVT